MIPVTVEATNCHRAYAAKGQSLAGSFSSSIIDFKDMPMGSVQIKWTGATGTLNGTFKVYASNLPEDATFDGNDLKPSFPLDAASGAPIWIRERLGFRYAQIRFFAGGVSGGTCDIIAIGKKS